MYLRMFVCLVFAAAPLMTYAGDGSLHSVNGVPLYIDGTETSTVPAPLSPTLIDQVKSVTTLGDALRILGPAYTAPDDSLHIAHWHFQNGYMLTLWPQGGESLDDTVSVAPRPDCGVPAAQCNDLVLSRKKSQQQKKQHGSSGGSSSGGGMMGGGSSLISPLMKMIGR